MSPSVNETTQWDLGDGYTLRLGSREELWPLIEPLVSVVFGPTNTIFPAYSEEQRALSAALRARLGDMITLYFGVFHGDQLVGWHIGRQENAARFRMQNSAILPEHRRRGLYSRMIRAVVQHVTNLGFVNLRSYHVATNNAVIIPKLKAGFTISGIELSDVFGTLVVLDYFASADRRKVLDYRCGLIAPDADITAWRENPRPAAF